MNKLIIICFLNIMFSYTYAQKKKEIQENKIKSVTVWQTDFDGEKETKYKDSYEEFNKNGQTIMKIEFNKTGDVKSKETAKYDSFDNKVEETVLHIKKDIDIKVTYKYNAFNQKTEEIKYSKSLMEKRIVYTYDAKGNRESELVYDSSGKLSKKYTYIYNKKKLRSKKRTFNLKNELESEKNYEYEFFK